MLALRASICAAVLLLLGTSTAVATTFDHGPYTGAPSASSVTVCWLSTPSVPARIEYGPRAAWDATGALPSALAVAAFEQDAFHMTTRVAVTGLAPATEYVYRVVLIDEQGETTSPLGAFVTAPPPGESVSFIVLADTQQQLEGINRLSLVGAAIAEDDLAYDFIVHAGDVVESPVAPYWDDWFASFATMLQRAPFLPVLGNHEDNHRSYYDTFELPPGAGKEEKQWWALHWGDVVIVGLDTNVSRVADYYAQQDWAREHLSGIEEHKFVVFHHPVFSSDAYHGSGYSYDVIYHPIFVEHGVDIVFNGHAHNYEHIERDGVVYLVVGGGGATPRALAEERAEGSILAAEGHHFYARVSTAPAEIAVDIVSVAVEIAGAPSPTPDLLIDAFTLPPTPSLSRLPSLGSLLFAVAVGALLATLVTLLLNR